MTSQNFKTYKFINLVRTIDSFGFKRVPDVDYMVLLQTTKFDGGFVF